MRKVDYIAELIRQEAPLVDQLALYENDQGQLCRTYGRVLCCPRLPEEEVFKCSRFRSKERLPVLTYHWRARGRAIFRSSQNMVGLTNKRSAEDEKMLQAIGNLGQTESKPKTCHIYDARPRFNALGNKLAGKGF
jgi:myotubularin-related protein 6/7/8